MKFPKYNPWSNGSVFTQYFRVLINHIAEAVFRFEEIEDGLRRLLAIPVRDETGGQAIERNTYRLIAAEPTSGNKWIYSAQKVTVTLVDTDFVVEDDDTASPITNVLNLAEINNDGTGLEGYGMPVEDDIVTIQMLAIPASPEIGPGSAIVELFSIGTRMAFQAQNQIIVTCPEDPVP